MVSTLNRFATRQFIDAKDQVVSNLRPWVYQIHGEQRVGCMEKRRVVNYERSILTYTDILGFRELVATRSAGEISRAIRIVRDVVQPRRFKSSIPQFDEDDFRNFSDLCLIR